MKQLLVKLGFLEFMNIDKEVLTYKKDKLVFNICNIKNYGVYLICNYCDKNNILKAISTIKKIKVNYNDINIEDKIYKNIKEEHTKY